MKRSLISIAAFLMMGEAIAQPQDGKVFTVNEKIVCQKVSFYNRLGVQVAGDLYLPEHFDRTRKYAAIVSSHPFGGVKEQSGGLYAQTMAERGFVALAIDLSYNGESGGQPRHVATPEGYVEDIQAAVDFIGTRPFVDRERIGVIGICGSGCFAVSAAAIDPRIKAVATVSMYDMGRANRQGLNDVVTLAERMALLKRISEQRWSEFEGAPVEYVIGTPEHPAEDDAVGREFYDYYRTPRGHHPSSTTATTLNSTPALMNFFPFANIELLSPRPVLFIAGEHAHSRYFSEDAYKMASQPKELCIVPGAGHVDLYDRVNLIPFDKLEAFFKANLK